MSQPAQPAGTIRVVTETPVEVPRTPGALAGWRGELSRRPWLAPAAILGLLAAYLLFGRR